MFKAALFDLDGVVFNTEMQYTVFWGQQAREFRPDIPGLEMIIKGQTLTQIFDAYFDGELAEKRQIITDRLNAFEQEMTYCYIEGFRDFVDSIRKRGVKTAVVTSSNIPKMEIIYRNRPEFKSLFDAILTSEDFERSKPDPDCYLKAAARLGMEIGDCIVFEDSFNGLKSGRAAGMRTVGLATTNPRDAIAPLSDLIIADFSESSLAEFVKE